MSYLDSVPQRGSSNDRFVEAREKAKQDREAAQQRERQKKVDETARQTAPVTPSGAHLTVEDVRMREACEADRLARRNQGTVAPAPVTSWRSLQALIEFWQRHADNAVNFYESEFNYSSLTNCLVTLVFGRQRPAIVETVAEAYGECLAGNHFELPRIVDGNGATIRKRGEPVPLPPTLYPAYVWPAQVAAAEQADLQRQVDEWIAGKKEAQKLSLDELKRQVRAGYQPPRPGGPNLDRS